MFIDTLEILREALEELTEDLSATERKEKIQEWVEVLTDKETQDNAFEFLFNLVTQDFEKFYKEYWNWDKHIFLIEIVSTNIIVPQLNKKNGIDDDQEFSESNQVSWNVPNTPNTKHFATIYV